MTTLSPDQETARTAIHRALRNGQRFVTLAGAAGTGKTTLLKVLLDDLSNQQRAVSLMAPTAKAALRMREVTGRPSATLHSQLYARVMEDAADEGSDESAIQEALRAVTNPRESRRKLRFLEPQSLVGPGELAIIDEASMVGKMIHNDIEATLAPDAQVLYVGDHAQLAPVNDTWGANLQCPDARLEQVHRQALDNPIIAYATAVREGWGSDWLRENYTGSDWRLQVIKGTLPDAVEYMHQIESNGFTSDTAMITWTNEDRALMNTRMRVLKGFTDVLLVGDRIRIKENTASGFVNGEVRTIVECARDHRPTIFQDTVFNIRVNGSDEILRVVPALFESDRGFREMKDAQRGNNKSVARGKRDMRKFTQVTYGQCLTAHAAQGSQYEAVCAYLNPRFASGWARDKAQMSRLLYTIATRATKVLCIVSAT